MSLAESLRKWIERVPPTEAEFIRQETRAALDQDSAQRFGILTTNRFYYPPLLLEAPIGCSIPHPCQNPTRISSARLVQADRPSGWPLSRLRRGSRCAASQIKRAP